MTLTRRTLLSLSAALPALHFTTALGAREDSYFPPPDAEGGWRSLDQASQARMRAGIDRARLDEAFQYVQTTSQHGGLLVLRHGYLVYERYFGRGNREANPDMYSIGKMFTSVACGIMLSEQSGRFPDGLGQKVFTTQYLPEAFPLVDSRMAEIRLGHLLTMTSGIERAHMNAAFTGILPSGGHSTGIVHGENVPVPYWDPPESLRARVLSQDGSALCGAMWAAPGEGYLYSRDPHVASIVLRRIVGMELEDYLREKLAKPMGWGRWGYALRTPDGVLSHTPGEGDIALHSTDALRFGYLLLQKGKWKDRQLVPREYIELLSHPSPFNPHSPFSLQFEVNADGHVAGAPRDAFFKSGAGGFAIYIVPSLDMVIYKMSSLDERTYDPDTTGLPLTYSPDTSRDAWKPHPPNQFLDGPIGGDAGVRRTLEMTIAAVMD